MKKLHYKSFISGAILALVGITTVFASSGIHSAQYRETKITLNGEQIQLKNQLVGIIKENENDLKMYMPVRELLESLGYSVIWNADDDTIDLQKNNFNGDTIIKNQNISLGYTNYFIDLEEELDKGVKWEYVLDKSSKISIVKDEYIKEDKIHRFTYSLNDELSSIVEGELANVVFEQTINGKKTGNKIIYKINVVVPGKPVIYLYPKEKQI